MSYRRRYYKLFYRKVWLRREVADRIRSLCRDLGMTLSDCLGSVVDFYLQHGTVLP